MVIYDLFYQNSMSYECQDLNCQNPYVIWSNYMFNVCKPDNSNMKQMLYKT